MPFAIPNGFSIHVRSKDPEPFTADVSVGRRWWIRGHAIRKSPLATDSDFVRREVRIASADKATGIFRFHLIDTISSDGMDSIEESEFTGSSRAGFGFKWQANPTAPIEVRYPESLPFNWPTDDSVFQNATYAIQGDAYPALRQILAKTCSNKGTCVGHEYFSVSGLGLVSAKEEGERAGGFGNSYAFEVWAVAGP